MDTLTNWPLGQPAVCDDDAWGTAYNVIAAEPLCGINVALTATFSVALASLWWQANGVAFADTETFTFGPWTVTSDTEVDWAGCGIDDLVLEVLYDGGTFGEEPNHVATVVLDGIGG